MRDPGPPRRNPFFEHGSEGATDDPGMGWRDPAESADGSGPQDAADAGPADDGAVGGVAALLALAEALGDAQPEVAEHLVAAAHEVVLTVKVLVDATEPVLAEQGGARAESTRAGDEPATSDAAVTDLAAVRRAEGP